LEKNPAPLLATPSQPPVSLKAVVNSKKLTGNNRTHQSQTDQVSRSACTTSRAWPSTRLTMSLPISKPIWPQRRTVDEKDSRHLMELVTKTNNQLKGQGLPMQCVLADSGFSSGENYAALEGRGLVSFVTSSGVYKPDRTGFTYQQELDNYVCPEGKVLRCLGLRMAGGCSQFYYYAKPSDCGPCALKTACCGRRKCKQITISAFRNHYRRMQARLDSPQGQRMKKRRRATVEPVFGSLLNYYGMRRVNTKGREAAHKVMLMAATAYNLQKLMAFAGGPKVKVKALTKALQQDLYFFVQVEYGFGSHGLGQRCATTTGGFLSQIWVTKGRETTTLAFLIKRMRKWDVLLTSVKSPFKDSA
jgi:hypothetical protein